MTSITGVCANCFYLKNVPVTNGGVTRLANVCALQPPRQQEVWTPPEILFPNDWTCGEGVDVTTLLSFGTPGTAVWTDWTPTVQPATGAWGSSVLNYARYLQIGKWVTFRMHFTIGANGTGAGYFIFTLPVVSLRLINITGFDTLNTWTLSGLCLAGSNLVQAYRYDGIYPWAGPGNGQIVLEGSYEVA